tara:strand:+ start:195 stop:632 length:438 start_codon:yes stop_codon:yes gene_type:complete
MATRSVTMVVDRELASHNEAGFACDPILVGDKSYVNMYLHWDGYPEFRGVELANWLKINSTQDGTALAAQLVSDNYDTGCYLYANHKNIDHHYTYIIWTGKKDIWMSCWNKYSNECVFVLKPADVTRKYKIDTDYTDWLKHEKIK